MMKASFTSVMIPLACAIGIAVGAEAARVQTNSFQFVDLSPFARATEETAGRQLPALLKGAQSFHGVPFRVDLPIAVTGIESARSGDFFPSEVRGIRIGTAAHRIHLLHTALFVAKDGTPLAKIVFHYADGGEETRRLGYGIHVRNWTAPRLEKTDDLLDPNSQLAWSDSNERRGDVSRVFQTAIENPRPGETIASIDVVSLFSYATPVILALSIERADSGLPTNRPLPTRKAIREMQELSDAAYRRELDVRVTADEGGPLTNAMASLTITDDKQTYFLGDATADAGGICRLPYPPQHTVSFGVWIHAPNRLPVLISESKANGNPFKDNHAVILKRGSVIGGVVKDTSGQPIAGADVVVHHITQTGTRHYTRIDYDSAVTDKDGKWTSGAMPEDLTGFTFQVFHPDYRPNLFATAGYAPPPTNVVTTSSSSVTYRINADGTRVPMTPTRRGSAPQIPLLATNDLRAGNAEMVLQLAPLLEGTLVDTASKPLPAAEIILYRPGQERSYLRTDKDGRFQKRVSETGSATLIVLQPGFSPLARNVYISTNATAGVQLKLEPPRTLRGRVQDQKQRPITGAKVRLDEWNGTSDLLKFQAVTDEQGWFTWTGAPPDNVMFYISKTNFSNTRHSVPGSVGSFTIPMSRPPGVYGRVYDAETKQPIQSFLIIPGRRYSSDESQPIQWERYEAVRGQNGEYSLRMSSYYFQPEGRVLVEAMGYEPQVSPPLRGVDSYTNDFALKKGKGIEGIVERADGSPVANAVLVVIEKGDNAYLDNASQVRSGSSGGDMARSDSQGRFAFSPKLAPQKIFVSHEDGYGEAKVSDVLKGGKIVLQKWSRVKGVVRVGDRMEPNQNVRLMNSPQRIYEANAPLPFLSVSLRVDPEPDGSFVFEKVPPGEHSVALEYRLKSENQVYEPALSHAVPITGKQGETTEVVLGGTGRRVTGRVQIVGGDSSDVDWKRDVHKLISMQAPGFLRQPSAAQTYVLLFESNGTFRVDNVPAGNYNLAINVTDPDDEYYNRRPIGSVSKPVTVPNERDAKVNAPFDIGSVELTIRPRVKIGKVVPSFDGKTADGKTIQLSDYRGKYVLLYFWGRTLGYSTYDFQVLKELQSTYGAGRRLMILGCNLDPDVQTAAQFSKSQGHTWTQIYLGSWNQTPIPGMFGLQGNTACVLIDPEGKLASSSLRGTAIRNLVTNAMANE